MKNNKTKPNTVDFLLLRMPKDVVVVSIVVLIIVMVLLLDEVNVSVVVCKKFGYMFK